MIDYAENRARGCAHVLSSLHVEHIGNLSPRQVPQEVVVASASTDDSHAYIIHESIIT